MAGPLETTPLVKRASLRQSVVAMTATLPGEEGSVGFEAGGCAPAELFSTSIDERQEGSRIKRESLIYSAEAEEGFKEAYPETAQFLGSRKGLLCQVLLIFVFVHFNAGTPILQDIWKRTYGGPDHQLLYTKPTLLIMQNLCEILFVYLAAFLLRGSVRDCFQPMKSLKFAPASACFGIQAVFGLFAMGEMHADCYALYAQSSIIVLTIGWTIFFRTRISGTSWMGIVTIALGMAGFNMSDKSTTARGLTFVACKIMCSSFACLYAEAFMKSDGEALYIQIGWIKPVELLSTTILLFVMPGRPGKASSLEEIQTMGFFHHWNWLTVFIMFFNMGGNFMTATIAKKFDSVVKGVAGIFGILYPTQVFVQLIEPPEYTPMKVLSAATILAGSLNFVLAKGEMKRSKEDQDKIQSLETTLGKLEGKDV